VHAIGDLANREALDAFEETRDLWRPLGLRPRIEHAQLLTWEDVPRVSRVWHPEQRLTLEEALRPTTVNPAWLARDEHRRGKLLPGYRADLVVLDRDPYTLEPEGLREVRVIATMLGGRWTHNPPPWDSRTAG
jgi:predicted amidohydrolase YtcJ